MIFQSAESHPTKSRHFFMFDDDAYGRIAAKKNRRREFLRRFEIASTMNHE